MKFFTKPVRSAPLVAMGFSMLLAACASTGARQDSGNVAEGGRTITDPAELAESPVMRRAVERWNFLIAHKAEKAYDYLSPGFRKTKSRDHYANEMNNRPAHWTKVYPYREQCDKPDVCVLDLQIDATVKMPGVASPVASVGFVTETWIRTHGKWYLLPNAVKGAGGK